MIRVFILFLAFFFISLKGIGTESQASTKAAIKAKKVSETFEIAIMKDKFSIHPSKPNLEDIHKTTTLLISCVDFRLRDETWKLMEEYLHLKDDYDEVAVPGAALAYIAEEYPHWGKTLDDIIGLVQKLHDVKRVIFLDHYGCGAYKAVHGEEHTESKESDLKLHTKVFEQMRTKMKENFPNLEVYTLIIGLDGVVDNIKPSK